MTIFEILLLAISLSLDTFAVSLCSGVTALHIERRRFVFVVASFALFQTGFTIAGWALGSGVASYIGRVDHWVAFVLLCYVGGKMIWENIARYDRSENGSGSRNSDLRSNKNGEKNVDIRNNRTLITVSVATSIDAFAVGISLAMVAMSGFKVCFLFISIALITAIAAIVGLKSGRKIGIKMGNLASILGGVVLIAIGSKILIEHINLF